MFLNCIDLEKGFNIFVAIEKETKEILTSTLGINFKKNIAKTDHHIMRKEMVPKIKEMIKSKDYAFLKS
ncbi:hypothetical protein HN799_04270 [Candidatus Woesearchaeota archaeon]|nr:hypothetical protein [Candidatus Woesearchaeota archaeon]